MISNGYLSAAVSLRFEPHSSHEWLESQCKEKKACSVAWGGFKIHGSADGRSPIADTCGWRHTERKETKGNVVCLSVTPFGWRHTERKETKGTRGLPERHTERKETKGTRGLPERHAFS